jgi:protein tyrosine phosphatase (PTP) superfamily phosphohydrolase (DUF442 family)
MKKYLGLLAAVALGLAGCRAAGRPATAPGTPGPGVVPPANPFVPPGAPTPVAPGGNAFVPPNPVPINPTPNPSGSAPFIPPGAPGGPPAGGPPAPVFPGTSGTFPSGEMQADYRWTPGAALPPTSSVFLMPPEPIVTEERKPGYSPTPEPPRIKEPEGTRLLSPEPPKSATKPSGLPVGIPQFASVVERVASGLRPSLDEGLDWLQQNGYRTVLFVRAPGEDDSADQKQVEKRGMKYLSVELSPLSLKREVVDSFNRIVGDSSGYPLFVYDRDGSLAGSLWYLHFRTSEKLEDDAARLRAGRLGLREDPDGPHRLMWLAIQKYLSER